MHVSNGANVSTISDCNDMKEPTQGSNPCIPTMEKIIQCTKMPSNKDIIHTKEKPHVCSQCEDIFQFFHFINTKFPHTGE